MTDELSGGAPAPAETPSVADTPAPAESSAPSTPEPTPRSAIDRAFEAVDAMERGEEAKPAAEKTAETQETAEKPSGDRPRNPDGTFAAKEQAAETQEGEKPEATTEEKPKAETAASDVPTRFSPDAKAEWEKTPPAVKGEVTRAIRELESGIQEHQKRWEPVKQYDDMAKQYGTTLDAALERYVAMDKLLNDNIVEGLASICADKGVDFRQVVAHITGQKPDERTGQLESTIRQLNAKIDQLEKGVGTIQQGTVAQQINSFVGTLPQDDQALFDELEPQIADQITQGKTLPDAFAAAKEAERTRVERLAAQFGLKPPAPTPAPTPTPDPSIQTRKGQLSVTGAPGPGSNPDARKTPSSPREALDNAFASVGL